ncbi:MAG: hypothetical protein H5U05_07000 [Candidatus Aminicenantes bacterium]|nr:hypothetical protein [Candidatus Aminicenantes bacterium]
MPVSLKVPYLSYQQIARVAAESLEKFGCKDNLPIPVEHIIDNILKINIIPFPNLFTGFEINAFTSSDLRIEREGLISKIP